MKIGAIDHDQERIMAESSSALSGLCLDEVNIMTTDDLFFYLTEELNLPPDDIGEIKSKFFVSIMISTASVYFF